MASTRLLRMSTPLGLGLSHEVSTASRPRTLMCLNKLGMLTPENPSCGGSQRNPVAVKAAGCIPTDERVDLALILPYVADAMSHSIKFIKKQRPWRLHIQMFVEKAIIDCRFLTLLAVGGSLLGSVLCFVEGCFLVLESYFHAISQMSEQGHVVLLLLEAIDMFLVATAMLTFGMALHVMFVGQESNLKVSYSTLPGNFSLQKLSSWLGMESVTQAKSKIGHALIMILQVQVLEKFKSIPVTNGVDLAYLAGAVFLSSASIFILSRIAVARAEAKT